jgi:hypothetical protein
MKKNILIIILSLLTITSFVYGFVQQKRMEKALDLAEKNMQLAEEIQVQAEQQRAIAEMNAIEAQRQRQIAMQHMVAAQHK